MPSQSKRTAAVKPSAAAVEKPSAAAVEKPSAAAVKPSTAAESTIRLYQYDACSTCKKARSWLDDHHIAYETLPIVEKTPSETELRRLVEASGLPARKWFNTSGQSYRALVKKRGKETVDALSEGEIIKRLAEDGKMIKRPVLVAGDRVLVGFREEEYEGLAR